MNQKTKQEIIDAMYDYCRSQGWANEETGEIGLNKISELTSITPTYLSPMFKGELQYKKGRTGELSNIPDHVFSSLAKSIGYSVDVEYWKHRNTSQFTDLIYELGASKVEGTTRMVIGESGCGKSYSIKKFKQVNPIGTYVIKCFRKDTLNDLLRKIETEMKIKCEGSSSERIDRIAYDLYRQARRATKDQERPLVVFDEAEALTALSFGMLKTLYDSLNWVCGIVLIGTDDLVDTLAKAKNSKKPGMPQFYRRFKAGIRRLDPVDTRYTLFLDDMGISRELQKVLMSVCDNYGELHDYLEPVLRKAAAIGVEPNEEFFRAYHKL
ncbi:MAG: AAA family ATPase [Bacteroidales bacterium]